MRLVLRILCDGTDGVPETVNAGDVEIRLQKAETRYVRMCIDQAGQDCAAATVDTVRVRPCCQQFVVAGREDAPVVIEHQDGEGDDTVVARCVPVDAVQRRRGSYGVGRECRDRSNN